MSYILASTLSPLPYPKVSLWFWIPSTKHSPKQAAKPTTRDQAWPLSLLWTSLESWPHPRFFPESPRPGPSLGHGHQSEPSWEAQTLWVDTGYQVTPRLCAPDANSLLPGQLDMPTLPWGCLPKPPTTWNAQAKKGMNSPCTLSWHFGTASPYFAYARKGIKNTLSKL